jgi:class 3 adenylate cyclase
MQTSPNLQAKPRALSLRAKWTMALLLLGCVPLLLLVPLVLKAQRDGLLHAEEAFQISIMDQARSVLTLMIQSNATIVHDIGTVLSEPTIRDDDAKIAIARSMLARAEALDSVVVYSADGRKIDALVRDGASALPSPEQLSSSQQAAMQDGRWLPASWDETSGLRLVYLHPLVAGGQRTGWVLGQLRTTVVRELLRRLSASYFSAHDDALVLVSPRLQVLANSRASRTAGDDAEGRSLEGKAMFAVARIPPERFAVPYTQSTEYRDTVGVDWVASFSSVPTMQLGVVAHRRSDEVFDAIRATRRALFIALATILALALLVGTLIATRTTKPISKLIVLAKSYAERKFAARSDVRTGDELESLGTSLERMADDLSASEKEIARRAAVEQDLSRFLPAKVAAEIADGSKQLKLGGERRAVSVLFADVVSFTPFAERAEPEKVVEFLNELFTVLTEVVFRHDGTVDKFIGDSVMAFFGAPDAMPDHAERAVACAEDMHRFVEATSPAWKEKYGLEVRIAVGVNSGEVLVGNLGSEARMDYTIIGDAVNVAARLESLARPGQTLVTQVVADKVKDAFTFHALGEHPLRGKEQPVAILELER